MSGRGGVQPALRNNEIDDRRNAVAATITPLALLRPAPQVRTIPRRRSILEAGLPAPRAPDC